MFVSIQDVVFVYRLTNETDIKWHSRLHSHPDGQFELHYFISGSGTFRAGPVSTQAQPGSVFICPPNVPHSVEAGKWSCPVTYYAILFTLDCGADESAEAHQFERLLYSAARKPVHIGRSYRFFFEELKEYSRSPSAARRQAALYQIVSFLYLMTDGGLAAKEPSSVHLEKALDLMQDHIFDRLRLADIAGELKITESYIIRLFRTKLNTTPMKYFTRLKVEAAAAMLTGTALAVYEIADRLRFYSEYHFSRVFKRYTGMAPTVYRSQQYHRQTDTGEQIYDSH